MVLNWVLQLEGPKLFTRLGSLSFSVSDSRVRWHAPVSALGDHVSAAVAASGNGCKENLCVAVSMDCCVARRAGLLERRVELQGRSASKGSRSVAAEESRAAR